MATQQLRLPAASLRGNPSRQAFLLLRTLYTVAPILFGLDKFVNILTDWPHYLAPVATQVVPVPAQTFMYGVGVVEVLAGLLVAWKPRLGSLVVALWLAGIITNLLLVPGFYDVALRDFGLLVGALALNRLAGGQAGSRVKAAGS
ncbi:hypothetical protein ACFQ36_06520 [Arthrobacter sp. GCM10027362]|uniref:hypothetical protein n=1 Tax=Arthrobacter sp. GCM10027362 TaxID=3273379 RepID=UPI003628E6BB